MSTVLSWSELQRELSGSFRVVSYDRAGLGWSELGPMPRTADRIVDELHALLERASILPPYVLVGHSFGGLTMPLFAARFPDDVAGMVLVDPVAPTEWNPPSDHDLRLTRVGAKVCRRAALLARFGLIRFVAFLLTTGGKKAASHLVRLISRGTPANAGSVSSPWFSALPVDERAMASVFWVQPKFALTIASQLENLPVSAERVGQFPNFSDKPVVILSARTAPERRRIEHASMAGGLPSGEHVLAENSNHWIMQEDPELVIRAIERVVKYSERVMAHRS
jgi:pimeloyl-ACP methyl ester carboxylesterase